MVKMKYSPRAITDIKLTLVVPYYSCCVLVVKYENCRIKSLSCNLEFSQYILELVRRRRVPYYYPQMSYRFPVYDMDSESQGMITWIWLCVDGKV